MLNVLNCVLHDFIAISRNSNQYIMDLQKNKQHNANY